MQNTVRESIRGSKRPQNSVVIRIRGIDLISSNTRNLEMPAFADTKHSLLCAFQVKDNPRREFTPVIEHQPSYRKGLWFTGYRAVCGRSFPTGSVKPVLNVFLFRRWQI